VMPENKNCKNCESITYPLFAVDQIKRFLNVLLIIV